MKVLIYAEHSFELWRPPPWFLNRLRGCFPELEVMYVKQHTAFTEHIRDASVVIGGPIRAGDFRIAAKLLWIHSTAAAVHTFLFPQLIESPVMLTKSGAIHGPVVAEHVIAVLFALAKRLPMVVRLQQQHLWGQDFIWKSGGPREVAAATLGIIGLGNIGSEVAKRGAALGMCVVGVRANVAKTVPDGISSLFPPSSLPQLLSLSDYVVLSVPLTPETQKLIGAKELACMKSSAYLINVGRGALIDELALCAALRDKQIAGAALDVFTTEPLPQDSPLWDLENLLISPHTGAVTKNLWDRHFELVVGNLRRFLNGEPLLGLVDKKRGY